MESCLENNIFLKINRMTPPSSIPIRYDCAKNFAEKVCDVITIKSEWKQKHLYEIAFTTETDVVTLFGDIDVKIDVTEQEFNTLNMQYLDAIKNFMDGNQVKFDYTIATGSSFKAKKISYRFYIPSFIGNAKEQQEFAHNLNSTKAITLENGDAVMLDEGVYHVGRKMRMLHAWKQTRNSSGLIANTDLWEKRPLKLVEGNEDDTILHNIREGATRMEQQTRKIIKKEESAEFKLLTDLVLECLCPERATNRKDWTDTIFAIKGTENSDRANELAHKFSQRTLANNYDSKAVDQVWKDGKGQKGIGSIKHFARLDNPVKYAELTNQLPLEFLMQNYAEGDYGLANIFCRVYGEDIVTLPRKESGRNYWMYDKNLCIWKEEKDDAVCNLFVTNMKKILNPILVDLTLKIKDASKEEGEDLKKKYDQAFSISQKTRDTKTASKCFPLISTRLCRDEVWAENLNSRKYLFPVRNGVIDFRDGTLRRREQDDYLTFFIDIDYEPSADQGLWDKFFSDVLNKNTEQIDFMQFYLGYCITGETQQQKILILEGSSDGANGKSVLLDCVSSLLTDKFFYSFNRKHLKSTDNANNDSLYNARFSRFVVVNEINEDEIFDEGLLKTASGGDRVTTSAKYKGQISYTPQFKFILPLNKRPPFDADKGAIWRRLLLMPFQVRFVDKDDYGWDDDLAEKGLMLCKDDQFVNKLKNDKSGLLAWLVKGAMKYYENPARIPPASLQQEIVKYREENNEHLCYIRKNYKITHNKKDVIPCSEIIANFQTNDKERQTQLKMSKAMKLFGLTEKDKVVAMIYPTDRKYNMETGKYEEIEIKDKGVSTKCWSGLRKLTVEEQQVVDV